LITKEAKGDPLKQEQLKREIAKYVHEISAEVSYGVIRFFELVLSRLFAQIYHKFHVRGADALRQASVGHELIYLPCHRSHMDYLLSVYVIHRYGINRPHTGAGSNLNIWPLGALLRRGGAFFLRRSFGGNKVYAAVFAEYLHYLMTKHHPIQFFMEGGRSRTGLLLKPKLGMLSMVVQSYLRQDSLPVLIVPVCVSYDRVVEIDSYFKEIYGAKKKRESIGQLLAARKILRQSLGGVYVNFGTPVPIESYFDRYALDWRAQSTNPTQRPAWLQEMVEHLGDDVIRDINRLTIVNPVALISFILLALPQRAYGENELLQMIQEIVNLLHHGPWGTTLEVPFVNASEAVDWAIKYSDIQRHVSPVGNVIHLGEEHAHKYTYYRNHMLSIFSIYGCIAQLMLQKSEPVRREELEQSALGVVQFLRDAFFIPTHNLHENLGQHISQMVSRGLIMEGENGELMTPGLLHPRYDLLRVLGLALKPFTDRISIANHLLIHQRFENDAQLQEYAKAVSERTALLSGATTLSPYEHSFIAEYIRYLRQHRALINSPEQSPQLDPAKFSEVSSTEAYLDRTLVQNLGKT
jgi:glycerol-3-phosphate O-acyltransferase